jgi:hypothetical protein
MKKLVVMAMICCCSCGTTNKNIEFVILRDVPINPKITVMPSNNTVAEYRFANRIEEIIIGYGVSVVVKPIIKEIETKKGAAAGQVEKTSDTVMESETYIYEKYVTLDDINADYIVFSNLNEKRIKIIKTDSREVLTSFKFSIRPKSSLFGYTEEEGMEQIRQNIHDALIGIGIQIREEQEEEQ